MSNPTKTNNNVYGTTFSRSQQPDNSTLIRRTLVEHGLRPVDDEKTAASKNSTIAAITAITQQHQDEQRELQSLNTKFAAYLDRVQYLEDHNQQLTADLHQLKEAWGGDIDHIHGIYNSQLGVLRGELDKAIEDQALQELKSKRNDYDAWLTQEQIAAIDPDYDVFQLNALRQEFDGTSMELEQLKRQCDESFAELGRIQNMTDAYYNEVSGLKNELDNHQLERIITENELQTLKEHAAFLKSIFRVERQDILSLNSPVLDVSKFYRAELANAISDIRRDFETLFQNQTNELEAYYTIKTEQVREEIEAENERKRVLASEGAVEYFDTAALASSIRDDQNDLAALKADNKNLQAELDAMMDDIERIQDENLHARDGYDRELEQIRQQIDDKRSAISAILENNVSLNFEISTYKGLLALEEQHLNRREQEPQVQSSSSGTVLSSLIQTQQPSSGGLLSSLNQTQQPSSGGLLSSLNQTQQPSSGGLLSSVNQTQQPSSGGLLSSVNQTQQLSSTPVLRITPEMKKMTVQKTARGPISFDSVDLEKDAIILVNEKYSGSEQSFQNWSIRRQVDQKPEIIYNFPSTFFLRPRQRIQILSKRNPSSAVSIGDSLVADRVDTWGIGQRMVTRLIDNNNEEKAVITQTFQ